jgi:hypothetical protein
MKVILIVDFNFTDHETGQIDKGTIKLVREMEMPMSPVGLTSLVITTKTAPLAIPLHLPVQDVTWNDHLQVCVVNTSKKVDEYFKTPLTDDKDWQLYDDYIDKVKE